MTLRFSDNFTVALKSRRGTYGRVALAGTLLGVVLLYMPSHRTLVQAAPQQQATAAAPDLEGGWVRTDRNASGAFDGLTRTFKKADLTPQGAALMAAMPSAGPRGPAFTESKVHAVGDPYIVVDKPCTYGGGGGSGINPDSSAIHIAQQKDEILLVREGLLPRHIYMDGRQQPDLSLWHPTQLGHSVGHYEEGDLLVETIGITQGMVPAGGLRTPQTMLIERFHVSPDNKHMTITYTWNDVQIYKEPHTYQYTFDRLPPDSYAFDEWCDASDPIERQSIVPPPQK